MKGQHIAAEVTSVDNKTKKNASGILALKNKLTQKEDTINENERGLSIFRGFFFYLQQNHLVYECKVDSFTFNNKKILTRKSTGTFNYSDYYSMKSIDKGYGICFDEGSEFGHTITAGGRAHTADARNVLIFGANMRFSVHATNRANNIYLMGTGIHKSLMTLRYMQKRIFT